MSDADIVERLRNIADMEPQFTTEIKQATDEITSLRAELAAMPQWRDKPIPAGQYVVAETFNGGTFTYFDVDWLNREDFESRNNIRLFGPIPTDPSKETGE